MIPKLSQQYLDKEKFTYEIYQEERKIKTNKRTLIPAYDKPKKETKTRNISNSCFLIIIGLLLINTNVKFRIKLSMSPTLQTTNHSQMLAFAIQLFCGWLVGLILDLSLHYKPYNQLNNVNEKL